MSTSFKSELPVKTGQSFRRRHVEQCLPPKMTFGCVEFYPQSQLNVTGDGGKSATRIMKC